MPKSAPVYRPPGYVPWQQRRRERDKTRPNASRRGYGYRWQKARAGWLRTHPLCVECEDNGLVVAASEVDHIIPHKGDMELFWSRDNWQSLCKTCHSTKTAKEDGAFVPRVY